jgi:CO dehydrogenase/acetyl-CoA synthase epsilon subunit
MYLIPYHSAEELNEICSLQNLLAVKETLIENLEKRISELQDEFKLKTIQNDSQLSSQIEKAIEAQKQIEDLVINFLNSAN